MKIKQKIKKFLNIQTKLPKKIEINDNQNANYINKPREEFDKVEKRKIYLPNENVDDLDTFENDL